MTTRPETPGTQEHCLMRWAQLLRTRAEGWTIPVRLMVGLVVFFPEGIQKLAFPKFARYGFWSMAHEARDDFIMLLGSFYLLIAGAGAWSLDAILARERSPQYRGVRP
jgi:hypothetical protein